MSTREVLREQESKVSERGVPVKYQNQFSRFTGDVLHQFMAYLDVSGIYSWYRAMRTDKAARDLFGASSRQHEWFRTMVMLPSPPRKNLPESVPLWYMSRARSVQSVCVYLHGCPYLHSFMHALCSSGIAYTATSLKLSVWSADMHHLMPAADVERVCEALITALQDPSPPLRWGHVKHFELHFQSFQPDNAQQPQQEPDTPLASVGHRLLGALFARCPQLERLEGTSTWPGFASLNAMRFLPLADRDKPPFSTALRQLSLFEATPLHGFIDESLELLADINDETAIFPNPDLDIHDNTLERQFQAFKPDLLPCVERVEMRFDDAQDAQRLFILWNFLLRGRGGGAGAAAAGGARGGRSVVGEDGARAVGSRVRELYLHLDFIDPTRHFEMQHLWNQVLRGVDRRGLPPLLPSLEVLTVDSWLLCGGFLDLLCGGRGRFERGGRSADVSSSAAASAQPTRKPLRLSLCPGDEDPCTAVFLEHTWCEASLPISHLHLRRRTLTQPGSMYARYLCSERRLGFVGERAARPGDAAYDGAAGFYSFFKDEYCPDDTFAARGAEYAQARTTVVRALVAALGAGKMRFTEELGAPASLLEELGCSDGERGGEAWTEADSSSASSASSASSSSSVAAAERRACLATQRLLRRLLSSQGCAALRSLVLYPPYPEAPSAPSSAADAADADADAAAGGGEGGGPRGEPSAWPLVHRLSRLLEAWSAVLWQDRAALSAWQGRDDAAGAVAPAAVAPRGGLAGGKAGRGRAGATPASSRSSSSSSSSSSASGSSGLRSGAGAGAGAGARSEVEEAPAPSLCPLHSLVVDLPLDLSAYLPAVRQLLSPSLGAFPGYRLVDCPLSPSGRDTSVLRVVFRGFRGSTTYFLKELGP